MMVMRTLVASVFSASMALALPLLANAQTAPTARAHAAQKTAQPASLALSGNSKAEPVWRSGDGQTLILSGTASAVNSIPADTVVEGKSTAAGTGVQLNVSPNVYVRAGVSQRNWLSLPNPACQAAQPASRDAACLQSLAASQGGEVGAGFSSNAIKLELSVGQSRTDATPVAALHGVAALPRVLPSDGGAAVAAPLMFPDSTTTSVNAHGQVRVLPNTQLDVGASQGRVHFLPGAGLLGNDELNQTTLSLGIEHGLVSGAIVGRVLQPALPGASFDSTQRWSGIDLGVSVRLPWQGELSFGAQNVWSSGKQPLLMSPRDLSPEQARVPYVQYHQEL
ncbi:MAG: hypothetical protein C4338_01670 [Rhodanobacteraceae bacterium]